MIASITSARQRVVVAVYPNYSSSLVAMIFVGLLRFLVFVAPGTAFAQQQEEEQQHQDATASPSNNATVSYVVEPFDSIQRSEEWFLRRYNDGGSLTLSLVDEQSEHNALFGSGALRVDYQVQSTESWGGFVDFGWIQDQTPYNCFGADYISLWYNNLRKQSLPGRAHFRIILLDGSSCQQSGSPCSDAPGQNLENYYYFSLDSLDADPGWNEIRVPLRGSSDSDSPFWRTGWTGVVGNDRFDAHDIRGWRLEWSIDSQAGFNATSEGTMLLDHLACFGSDGKLFGAAFHAATSSDDDAAGDGPSSSSFARAVEMETWYKRSYQSPLAENLTDLEFTDDAMLLVNYTVEQVEEWGGFNDYGHLAPGNAYYNLSGSSHVSFDYRIYERAQPSERCHVRFILMDDSDCDRRASPCDFEPYLENYYTFNHILDSVGTGVVTAELEGDDISSSPFYRPGWTGIVGNNKLDKQHIKGYRIELNVGSNGEVGSLVRGRASFGNVQANGNTTANASSTFPSNIEEPLVCRYEPGLRFDVRKGDIESEFTQVEFAGGKCCEQCEKDDDCLYALTDGRDCYTATVVQPSSVQIVDSDFSSEQIRAFATSSASKRGDYCLKCDCYEDTSSIDCRNKNLTIIPKLFDLDWKPKTIDLRNNNFLVMIGAGSFDGIGDGLERIFLPDSIVHLSPKAIDGLPRLSELIFDGKESSQQRSDVTGAPLLNNAISNRLDAFGNVCCNRGRHLDLTIPTSGLTFCDLEMKMPGDDSTYDPFVMYMNAAPGRIMEVQPRSPFMGEAAESVFKCAEYCSLLEDCKYFSYDSRWKESEHRCIMLSHNGTHSEKECCQPDHYGDEEGTIPGWISGKAPRARFLDDNARVLVGSNEIHIDERNNFTSTYRVSLGSNPLRGAVWITPVLSDDSAQLDITIIPERIALYDDQTTQAFQVSVLDKTTVSTGTVVTINNLITSCDSAFTATDPEMLREQTSVRVAVIPSENRSYISPGFRIAGVVFIVVQCTAVFFFGIWTYWYRDEKVVRMSQPIFLGLILFGCLMLASSILPTLVQDSPDGPTTQVLDASCMAFPWLFNMGFILIFSALFAKIRRVRLVVTNANQMRRVSVRARDVTLILVAFSSVPFIILLCWQLIDPLRWDRKVTLSNNYGYELESVGFCNSEHAIAFLIPLALYDLGCLLYALYLCYRTRNVSSELNEAKWITASIISIFQILLLGIPVLVIAWADSNVFFFIRACVVFLVSFGVTLFIFLPKFLLLHFFPPQNHRSSSMYISGSVARLEQRQYSKDLLRSSKDLLRSSKDQPPSSKDSRHQIEEGIASHSETTSCHL